MRMAPAHLDATNPSERVIDAIRATASDTEKDVRDTGRRVTTQCALELLTPGATTPIRRRWHCCRRIRKLGGRTGWRAIRMNCMAIKDSRHCRCRWPKPFPRGRRATLVRVARKNWRTDPLIREQAFGESLMFAAATSIRVPSSVSKPNERPPCSIARPRPCRLG